MPFLGLVDVSGIQRFVFRSPELKVIAVSSERIEKMTHQGALFAGAAKDAGAEMIIAAGGNAAFTASTREDLMAVFRSISRTLLKEGDGLEVVVSLVEYEAGKLARDYQKAIWELERRKLTQPRNVEFRPSGFKTPPGSISPNPTLRPFGRLTEPLSFENLICASDEQTDLMAVVSVDGLGMGKRLQSWMQTQRNRETPDQEFIAEYRRWSDAIKQRWAEAWKLTRQEVERQFGTDNSLPHPFLEREPGKPRSISLRTGDSGDRVKQVYLPCRRIYQGGDDLSFVCDARLALALTATLVAHLETPQEGVPAEFREMTVSVGIVYVDSHFPFARAVRLADSVRASAKKWAEEIKSSERRDSPPSTLDWWINRQGDMERSDPVFKGASLKPYVVHEKDASEDVVSWEMLQDRILPGLWKTFGESRNKLKDLLAAVEEGEEGAGVRQLLQLRPIETDQGGNRRPFAFLGSDFNAETGFAMLGKSKTTPLLDAGELFDIHFPFADVVDKERA